VNRWISRADFAAYLEDREAENSVVPFPEIIVTQSWGDTSRRLVEAGVCAPLAGSTGLPDICLELCVGSSALRLRALREVYVSPDTSSANEVVFVNGPRSEPHAAAPKSSFEPAAVGLPLDAELFDLLSSESAISSIVADVRRGQRFSFSTEGARTRLRLIWRRLLDELRRFVADIVVWSTGREFSALPELLRMLHVASDACQVQHLLAACEAVSALQEAEPPTKKCCVDAAPSQEMLSELAVGVRQLVSELGLNSFISVDVVRVEPGVPEPQSRVVRTSLDTGILAPLHRGNT